MTLLIKPYCTDTKEEFSPITDSCVSHRRKRAHAQTHTLTQTHVFEAPATAPPTVCLHAHISAFQKVFMVLLYYIYSIPHYIYIRASYLAD